MLVLSRKLDQSIQIGDEITVTIVSVKGNTVRLGISAPDHIRVARSELHGRKSHAPEAQDRAPHDSKDTSGKSTGSRLDTGSKCGATLPNPAWPADSVPPLVVEIQTNPTRPVSFDVTAGEVEPKFQRPLSGRLGRHVKAPGTGKAPEEPVNLEKLFPAGGYQVFQTRVHQIDVEPIDLADTNCQ